jgi:hypothetical protein
MYILTQEVSSMKWGGREVTTTFKFFHREVRGMKEPLHALYNPAE